MDLLSVKLIVIGLKERYNVLFPTEKIIKSLTKEEKLKPLPLNCQG